MVEQGVSEAVLVYFGEALTKLDDKGRITVPRRVRETMNAHGHAVWYMTRGFDGCIFLFNRDEWNEIRATAGRHGPMNARSLDFRRMFFGSVSEVKPDGQGRMPVASYLREHADLDRDAVLVGVDDHLELWNKDAWQEFLRSREDGYKEMANALFSEGETLEAATEKGAEG